MEHTVDSKEGGKAIITLLLFFAIVLILIRVVRGSSSSFHYPKDKCILPNAKYGCKRKYPDGSYDCIDCGSFRRKEFGESSWYAELFNL